MRKIIWLCCFGICLGMSSILNAMSVIRDTEVETVLLNYIRPIFKVAGLNPNEAEVVVVNDPSINAFVAGGQTIFIHTGLILKAKNPDELVFVLSHETGHIVGGHVVRGHQELQKAQTTALISTVLGGVLAVASGHPDAGMAVMMGGQNSALGLFVRYRQTEESSADRTAVDILNQLGYSMRGFEGIMKSIKAEERLNEGDGGYLKTHPMTGTRVNELKRFLNSPLPIHQEEPFDFIKAKLYGFLEKPDKTLREYTGTSDVDKYAQAIAYYRHGQFKEAFQGLEELIQRRPDNPYFYELKGQLLFETGRLVEAEEAYGKAYQMKKDSDLIALSYAHVLLEQSGLEKAQKAEKLLHFVCQKDPENSFGWQLLAKAYDRQGKQNEASYAMVMYEYALGHTREAQKRAKQVIKRVPQPSVMYQKLKDMLEQENKE